MLQSRLAAAQLPSLQFGRIAHPEDVVRALKTQRTDEPLILLEIRQGEIFRI
jgi:hypothetical protein